MFSTITFPKKPWRFHINPFVVYLRYMIKFKGWWRKHKNRPQNYRNYTWRHLVASGASWRHLVVKPWFKIPGRGAVFLTHKNSKILITFVPKLRYQQAYFHTHYRFESLEYKWTKSYFWGIISWCLHERSKHLFWLRHNSQRNGVPGWIIIAG